MKLPKVRKLLVRDEVQELAVAKATREWWARISRMPHCVVWAEADWGFALATAYVADDHFQGISRGAAAELRQREALMGVTVESRRTLRIRYLSADQLIGEGVKPRRGKKPATVTALDARRARLIDADAS